MDPGYFKSVDTDTVSTYFRRVYGLPLMKRYKEKIDKIYSRGHGIKSLPSS